MPPLLSIKNLNIQFNNEGVVNTAVHNISLDVARGEIFAIVGESGSGKSVTALSILHLLSGQSTTTGDILFYPKENEPINLLKGKAVNLNAIRGKQISMIFQEPMTSLNPVFKCGHQVMEALCLHEKISKKEARERTIELFRKVNLPDPAAMVDRYPHQLSGGQKQRVMIAMAMSCNPGLLIADEPTTALDVTVQKTILELIASLQKQNNMGVILITHDLGLVADIADSIAVMYRGNIVETGRAAAILQNPRHPYTKALLACRPVGKAKGERLPVVSDFLEDGSLKNPGTSLQQNIKVINKETGYPILRVKNLSVHFPAGKNIFGKSSGVFKAVDDISFSVAGGETLGLVGESGCGKTTLGRAILQLLPITSGEILLRGENIAKIKPSVLRRMRKDLQIVFQDPYGSLDPRITIGNAILEPLSIHGLFNNNKQRREKVMALLEKVSLPTDHFNRYPHQFSGGQRQRICIARALATDPSFLIFDESVSALDASVQAQVLNLLNDLKEEFGFTAIFISHDLSVVHYICNRIMVMNRGKIIEEGDADQVFYNPQHEYTQKLIQAIPGKKMIQSP